jgi:hypothetical protein
MTAMRSHPLGEVLPARRALTPAGPACCRGAARFRLPGRCGHHRPDREPGGVGPDAPAPGQVVDNVEATAALRGHWPGSSSAVSHGNLDGAISQGPGETKIRASQRPGVPDGIAQQFADNQGCVEDDTVKDPGRSQLGCQPAASHRNTRRGARQEYGARYSHLPVAATGRMQGRTAGARIMRRVEQESARPAVAVRHTACRGDAPRLLTGNRRRRARLRGQGDASRPG